MTKTILRIIEVFLAVASVYLAAIGIIVIFRTISKLSQTTSEFPVIPFVVLLLVNLVLMLMLFAAGVLIAAKRGRLLSFIAFASLAAYWYACQVVFWALFPNSAFSSVSATANIAVTKTVMTGLPMAALLIIGYRCFSLRKADT
jgi:uncharacterized membrane protein